MTSARALYATDAQWTAYDPVLAKGAFAHATDTGEVVIGNGSSKWSALTPLNSGGGGGSGGLVLLASGSVTGSSGVSLDNVFTSAYKNYRVELVTDNQSANAYMYMRLRSGGSDYSGTTYTYSMIHGSGSGIAMVHSNGLKSYSCMWYSFLGIAASGQLTVVNPALTAPTTIVDCAAYVDRSPYTYPSISGAYESSSTSYDGISLWYGSTVTFDVEYRLWGVSNS